MKILMVNKFFYIKGGSETYYFALKRKLEKEGHTVVDFSMKDEKNYNSKYSEYFVDNVDYSKETSLFSKIKMATSIIYSREAKRKFERLVIKERPDIVHLHIFQHQLSPSILDVCKKYNIPTVYTAHDLKMICLNYKMMHHGHICEDCKDGHLYHCALNKCVKDSFSKSCINTIEGYFHKWRKSYDVIDYIITPSEFYRNKFIEFGVDSKRIVCIPNFIDKKDIHVNTRDDKQNYYLYFGRLSDEKGIMTLVKAATQEDIQLYIVGTGPILDDIVAYLENSCVNNVKILGFKTGQELIDIVGNAKAVFLPSEWYENGPYSAIESIQMGTPIIGANIGGIPEVVCNKTCLFESGNETDLKNHIEKFEELDEQQYEKLRQEAKELFESKYTGDIHYKAITEIYNKALSKKILDKY